MQTAKTVSPTKQLVTTINNHWTELVLVILTAIVLLWGLGQASLEDWDEAIYAQVAKEIAQTDDWITLHWEFEPYFNKPPLLMWSTAILFQLFGMNEFWARATSAWAGIALVMATYYAGKFVYSRWVGFGAALILLTSYQFVRDGRSGTTNMPLSLFVFLAVYAYMRLKDKGPKNWYVIGLFSGLAIMTKSAGGLVAPAVIGVALILDRRLLETLRSRYFWKGVVLGLVIVLPWHIAVAIANGQAFLDIYFLNQVFARVSGALEKHTGPPYYYIDRLQKYFSPWFYLVPFALALTLKENLEQRAKSRTLLVLFALVFGLYTIAQTKLRWYILPLYPALAIFVAAMIVEAFRSHKTIAFSGLAVGAMAAATIASKQVVLLFGSIALMISLGLLVKKLHEYKWLTAVMAVFLLAVGFLEIRPIFQLGEDPLARLATMAGDSPQSEFESLIVFSGLYRPAPLFYSNRPINVAYSLDDLAEFTQDGAFHEIILEKDDIADLSVEYVFQTLVEDAPYTYALIAQKDGS